MIYLKKFESYMRKASNILLEEFVPKYFNFRKTNLKKFKGYKVVEKINLNYYSVISGMFRYQVGRVKLKSYTSLYKRNVEYFNDHLLDRISVFRNKEDAIKALILSKPIIKRWSGNNNQLALMEITISGNIESAKFSNKFIKGKNVFIAETIDSVKEISII